MIKGETPKTATPVPLISPMTSAIAIAPRQPAAMIQTTASGMEGAIEVMMIPDRTEVSAIVVPTARSKPPVRRTIICPSDTSTR